MTKSDPPSASASLHSSIMESSSNGTIPSNPERRWSRSYDEGEDVTAPKSRRAKYMNQSFISMIASVGLSSSIADFGGQDNIAPDAGRKRRTSGRHAQPPVSHTGRQASMVDRGIPAVERRRAEHRMLQSSPGLAMRPRNVTRHRAPSDTMLRSQILVPPSRTAQLSRSVAPVTKASEAVNDPAATEEASNIPTDEPDEVKTFRDDVDEAPNKSLPAQLSSMFNLEQEEEVIAEFPCSLLQDIEQQGYLYQLQHHLCFYSYLPKRTERTAKSGFLMRRGRHNPRFNRYWCVLQGDVLSYYTNRDDLYFPRNTIDLRSAVSTQVQDPNQDGSCNISITAPQGTFIFKAEDRSIAEEWSEQIKQVIFRSHHTGDSIKLRIPMANILEIEDSQIGSLANMISVKFVEDGDDDTNDTLSIQEYLFSFVSADPESFHKLRAAVSDSAKTSRPTSKGRSSDDLEDVSLDSPPTEDAATETNLGASIDNDDRASSPREPPKQRPQPSSLSSSQQTLTRPSSTLQHNGSFASITGLYRAGAERLRQASGLAGTFGQQSKQVGSRLATGSKGYYEKMSGMWVGNKTHYDVDENPVYVRDEEDGKTKSHGDSFRQHFALPSSEKLRATFFVHMLRNVPIYGKMYVGSTKLCFRSLALPRTKMILPFRDIESVGKEKGFTNLGYAGVVVMIKGREELFFEFAKDIARDDFHLTMMQILDSADHTHASNSPALDDKHAFEAAKAEHEQLQRIRRHSKQASSTSELLPDLEDAKKRAEPVEPVIFDDLEASILDFQPAKPLHITCLTIGSRGDVQPYIALCKGLIEEGHNPVIATHEEFEPWIRSHGIEFKPVAGDPGKIMKLCVENDMFTVKFMQEAQSFRGFLDELFISSWEACQGTDVLIESPSAMCGIHIAEALQIPYFRAFTMPWSPTRAYPHAFAVMNQKMGGKWNRYSYMVFDWAFWQSTAGQLNRFRTRVLGLPKTGFSELRTNEVPFLYNFSPSVVVPPLDFGPQIHITGYWFLDEGTTYMPPPDLVAFIDRARTNKKKLVYVGFGSITVDDPAEVTRAVSEAVQDADVRCILCKGWSDRLDKKDPSIPEIPLPESIFLIKAAPHDWLFKQVDAAVHHGGAGTTGASLRAGIPTVVKSFFGDQHFFASRINDLEVGISMKVINSKALSMALREATQEPRLALRAKALGEKIRSEDGVKTAIKMIYRDMEYAKSLIKDRTNTANDTHEANDTHDANEPNEDTGKDTEEESWDLLSNESGTESPEATRKSTSTILDFQASLNTYRASDHGLDGDSSTSARSSGSEHGAQHDGHDSDEL